uniref:Dolichyldiphosphatase n=1 Tax=Rhodnius prolixus TaxID=13249 RepID=T1HBQ7_RHOPR
MASANDEFLHGEDLPPVTEWIPLSLTFVEYPKGMQIIFFLGTLLNELINIVLKNIICEPRPLARNVLYTEYGMPSAHAQFSWFFATYIIYFVLIRLHHMNNNTTLENVWKTVIIVGCVFLATVISISRIYLQYHTWNKPGETIRYYKENLGAVTNT